jgi:hypothetical protein
VVRQTTGQLHLLHRTPPHKKSVLQICRSSSILVGAVRWELELGEMASEVSNAPSVVQRYSSDLDSFDVGDTKVQHFGLLMKKPFGHKSTRWQRR